jgi:hypothetical protein
MKKMTKKLLSDDSLDYYKKCFELVVEEAEKRQELCNTTEDEYHKQVYRRMKGSLVTFQRIINKIEQGGEDESNTK